MDKDSYGANHSKAAKRWRILMKNFGRQVAIALKLLARDDSGDFLRSLDGSREVIEPDTSVVKITTS